MKKFVCLFLSLFFVFNGSIEAKGKVTVCLNMIVKDEARVIEKALLSVKPLIDYWVIVDTGSTDGTQGIIKECLKEIPGELHEKPWVNFSHNRNEALQLAKNKGDYLFFLDADEVVIPQGPLVRPSLEQDFYLVAIEQDATLYHRSIYINNHLDWHWEGIIHEGLVCKQPTKGAFLEGFMLSGHSKEGCRTRDPNKFLKDAMVLEDALKKDPNNSRYYFYLGQSYLQAEQYEPALRAFQKRATMGGDAGEVFWSLYKVGVIQEELHYPTEEVVKSYTAAFQARPKRAEPLFRLASYFFEKGNYILSYVIAKEGLSIPMPKDDVMYVEFPVYDYLLSFTLANALASLGHSQEAKGLYEEILKKPKLLFDHRERVEHNLNVVMARLQPKG